MEATSSTSYTDLSHVGPSLTIPFAGDYDVTIGADFQTTNGANISRMSYAIGGTAASDLDSIEFGVPTVTTALYASLTRVQRKTDIAAATALVAKYRHQSAVSNSFGQRVMSVLPVRVG